MFLLIVKNANPKHRGKLKNTLLEIQPNIFIGAASARIRQDIWQDTIKITKNAAIVYQDGEYYKIEKSGIFANKIIKIGAIYFSSSKSNPLDLVGKSITSS